MPGDVLARGMAHQGHNGQNASQFGCTFLRLLVTCWTSEELPLVADTVNVDIIPEDYQTSDGAHQTNNANQILNPAENDYLRSFFENPDGLDASEGLMNMTMGSFLDQKHNAGPFDFTGGYDAMSGTIHNPSNTLAGTPSTNYETHGISGSSRHMDNSSDHFNTGRPFTDTGSTEVLNGANTLFSLASSNHHDRAQAMYNNTFNSGASWGNFGSGNPVMPVPANLQSPLESSSGPSGRGSASSSYTPSAQTHANPFGGNHPSQTHQYPVMQQFEQQLVRNGNGTPRHNSLSLDTSGHTFFPQFSQQQYGMPHSAFPQSHQPQRPSMMVRFGSDSNFVQNGYRPGGYIPDEDEKAHSLIGHAQALGAYPPSNMPQAPGFRPHAQQQQQQLQQQRQQYRNLNDAGRQNGGHQTYGGLPHSSPMSGVQRQGSGFSSTSGQHFDQQDDEEEEEAEAAQHRPKKRRKSRLEQQEDEEFNPNMPSRGFVPKRGPKVPKAEPLDDDVFTDAFTTPTNRSAPKRRKSTAGHMSLASSNTSTPPSVDVDSGPGASMSAGAGGGSRRKGREPKSRQNLTEEQKRSNHIASEQKRRDIIKKGYKDLDEIVPSLSGGKSGLSKSDVLKEAILYLEATVSGNQTLRNLLDSEDTSGGAPSYPAGSGAGAGAFQ